MNVLVDELRQENTPLTNRAADEIETLRRNLVITIGEATVATGMNAKTEARYDGLANLLRQCANAMEMQGLGRLNESLITEIREALVQW